MIDSPKKFRQLVLSAEQEFKRGSLNGAFNLLHRIKGGLSNPDRDEIKLCSLIERIVQNRSGYLTFESTANLKKNPKLTVALLMQKHRNQAKELAA